jgi:hypothetical protein
LRFFGGGEEPGKTIAMFGRFAVFAPALAGILGSGLLLLAADFTTFIIAVDCSCCRWATWAQSIRWQRCSSRSA